MKVDKTSRLLVKELMSYNERVLYFGTVLKSGTYTMKDLKEKIFFNEIFLRNMQEIFRKHPCQIIAEDYIRNLHQYVSNMNNILYQISFDVDPKIRFERVPNFERRLITATHMKNQLHTGYYLINNCPEFLDDTIYYISRIENNYIRVSYIDPKKSIYDKILSKDFGNYRIHWKNDDAIMEYIKDIYQDEVVAIKVSNNKKSGKISKVEFNGSAEIMKSLINVFPRDSLILSNSFIYTDDIRRIIDQEVQEVIQEIPVNNPIESLEEFLKKDILTEYPSSSFDMYLQFLYMASKSDKVEAIYLTLYRIGDDPRLYYILKNAADSGIRVHVNIELYASGETINQFWYREMKRSGIYVTTYASGHLKVHSKLTLIQMKDGKQIVQVGTGNYNTQTTSQYTDLSLITSHPDICQQVRILFNIFDGFVYEDEEIFDASLLVTRYNARRELIKLIKKETSKGRKGYISIKCNTLWDPEIIGYLDEAANMGCEMDLIIRDACLWIPNQLDYTVKIRSIVWDKLEHSRVYSFGKENPVMYIGSLDLVQNKFNNRIETLVRVTDPAIVSKLCEYLNQYIINSKNAWELTRSGAYRKMTEG